VLKLAVRIKKRIGERIQSDDLFQAGCLGLMHAARQYDTANGAKFITYAHHCVHGYIMSYVSRNYSLIRCPIHMQWDLLMGRMGGEQSETVQRIQNPYDLSETENFDVRKVGSYRRRGANNGEAIPMDKEAISRDELLDADDLDRTMKEILSSREYDILTCRAKSYTLKEIGAKHGVSKERARQIEAVAIEKVKAHYGVGYKYA
jgi:RNA polymerase sigma factor (sigma-70 family)